MTYADLTLPIPASGLEVLDVLDSTKLARFLDCPRGFFFEYLLGWRRDSPNVHLRFGSAWHEGMEVLMNTRDGRNRGYTQNEIQAAYAAFSRVWDELGADEDIMIVGAEDDYTVSGNDAKNKENAFMALVDYALTYRDDSFQTLYTEVSGAVPIQEDRLIYFKLDSIVQAHDGIWSYEHKTTGRKTGAWADKWQMMLQVGTYAHVLNLYYGEDARGIVINGAVLRKPLKSGKSNNEFLRIPVRHTMDMMALWLWEINYARQLLDFNMRALAEADPDDKVMRAFPRNSESCSKFGCKHPHLCGRLSNPLHVCDTPPIGYHVEHWDPRNRSGDDEASVEKPESAEQVTIVADEHLTLKGVPGPGK